MARLKNFLMSWLLVLGQKKGLLKCAAACVKSEVITTLTKSRIPISLEKRLNVFVHFTLQEKTGKKRPIL